MKRRELLKNLAVASSASVLPWAIPSTLANAPGAQRRVESIGVQLYTVRDRMAEDVVKTLEAVAQAGYSEVETAGTGDLNAQQFAQALADNNLRAPAAHVPINLLSSAPDELLKTAQTIGYQYLVVPWLPPEMRTTEGYSRTIDALNTFGELSAKEGVQTSYHNHDFEFETLDGALPMDLMLSNCDADLVRFELDLFWAVHAGVDPAVYLRADPERFPLCHVKDRTADGQMVDVGKGIIDFPALFAAGSGLRHYFVEHDRPGNSMQSIRASIQAIQDMRY